MQTLIDAIDAIAFMQFNLSTDAMKAFNDSCELPRTYQASAALEKACTSMYEAHVKLKIAVKHLKAIEGEM